MSQAGPPGIRVGLAPAKLNLFLHVTGRRTDGHHNLQTLFQLLDYADEIEISATHGDAINVACDVEIPAADNLVQCAAELLRAQGGIAAGADIVVRKRVPVAAGLGGGSSDAATALLMLNRLWDCRLDTQALCRLGVVVGADVPVFIHGCSAWAEGVGEMLQPVELPQKWYAVFVPPVAVSTRVMFHHPELRRDCVPVTMEDYHAGRTVNVFQGLAAARYPEIAYGLEWLGGFAEARLSGTGGAFFALFDDEAQARAVMAQRPADFGGFVARGINRSSSISPSGKEPG